MLRPAPLASLLVALGATLAGACAAPAPSGSESKQASSTRAPSASSARGRTGEGRFHTDALGVDKRYRFYLPAGYDDGAARFPVVYYLHGLGGSEDDWLDQGGLAGIADRLGLRAIVIMPDGDDGFYANSLAAPLDYDACLRHATKRPFRRDEAPASFCVRTPRYEDYLTHDLVAHVDATFRTVADRADRGIAGLSMGGFGALSQALRHPDLYGAAASHSGVVALLYGGPHPYRKDAVQVLDDVKRWGESVGAIGALVRGIFGGDVANWRAHDPATLAASLTNGKLALYLDCGSEDGFQLQDSAAYLHDLLVQRGIAHEFVLAPGRHDFSFWRAHLPASLGFFARFFAASATTTGG